MDRILLKNGYLLTFADKDGEIGDILIEGENIVEVGEEIRVDDALVIDCFGLIISPGLIDTHVHLRQPGYENKETIYTGSLAAAAGGFTRICCMANTNPVNDTRVVTDFILKTVENHGTIVQVSPIGSVTVGLQGKNITKMAELKDAGCVGVSDDGFPIIDSRVMRRALEYAKTFGLLLISHSEDLGLSRGGMMHEGVTSVKLGLVGIPSEAETLAIQRDLALAKLANAKIHIAHVSCAESVEVIKLAKMQGISCTAETSPHYLAFIDEDVGCYNTNFKVNPPLRSLKDQKALYNGLSEGIIDIVATDHAPHSFLEKEVPFDQAPFGMSGLETALSVMLDLVDKKILTLRKVIQCMSYNPAKIFGLMGGTLERGNLADITVIDPKLIWNVKREELKSLSSNNPFMGSEMLGRAVFTICKGRITSCIKKGINE